MARRLFHFGASNQEESSRNNRTSVKSSKQTLVVYASKSWWMNRLTGSRQDEALDGRDYICLALHPSPSAARCKRRASIPRRRGRPPVWQFPQAPASLRAKNNAQTQNYRLEPSLASPLGGFGARNRPQTMQPKHSTETCTKRDVTPSHPIIPQEKR